MHKRTASGKVAFTQVFYTSIFIWETVEPDRCVIADASAISGLPLRSDRATSSVLQTLHGAVIDVMDVDLDVKG